MPDTGSRPKSRFVAAEIDEPVLLVGHSYGGSVITAAGTAQNVVGLVYISWFAPDEGENLTDLQRMTLHKLAPARS